MTALRAPLWAGGGLVDDSAQLAVLDTPDPTHLTVRLTGTDWSRDATLDVDQLRAALDQAGRR